MFSVKSTFYASSNRTTKEKVPSNQKLAFGASVMCLGREAEKHDDSLLDISSPADLCQLVQTLLCKVADLLSVDAEFS